MYDGNCGLCSHAVQFILKHESSTQVYFSALESPYAQDLLKRFQVDRSIDSMVYIDDEKAYLQSDAALKVAGELKRPWCFLAKFSFIPKGFRDFLYNQIAQNRMKLFRKQQCLVPSSDQRKRFLD